MTCDIKDMLKVRIATDHALQRAMCWSIIERFFKNVLLKQQASEKKTVGIKGSMISSHVTETFLEAIQVMLSDRMA